MRRFYIPFTQLFLLMQNEFNETVDMYTSYEEFKKRLKIDKENEIIYVEL